MIIPALGAFSNLSWHVASTAATVSVSTVAKEFFTHLFLFPQDHIPALIALAALPAAAVIGGAWLLKKAYEKYWPQENP